METTKEEIYKPKGSVTLDTVDKEGQRRIGIQGFPKTGKTYEALTFPNPVVLSFDRGLASHTGRADVIEVPFWDDKFVDSIVRRTSPMYVEFETGAQKPRPANRKDALIKWLYDEAPLLTKNQTLVLDGNTGIQAGYHIQYWTDPAVDRDGKLKPYVEYNQKIKYFTELCICLKSLKCDVIYLTHEAADRDDKGNLNGQIRPLMSGQFLDELQSHFTDWFRALTIAKPSPEKMADFKKAFFLDDASAKEWIESTPPTHKTIYVWLTSSDEMVKCGTSLVGAPKYILANYKSFSKYKNKTTV